MFLNHFKFIFFNTPILGHRFGTANPIFRYSFDLFQDEKGLPDFSESPINLNVINLTAKPKRGMNLGVMQVHSSLRFPLAKMFSSIFFCYTTKIGIDFPALYSDS